jgi:hypothetical protein
MLFREIISVYCENHTKHINTLRGQMFNAYHHALAYADRVNESNYFHVSSRHSPVGIVTKLPGGTKESGFDSRPRQDIIPLHSLQTGPGFHRASYPMAYFLGVNWRPERETEALCYKPEGRGFDSR